MRQTTTRYGKDGARFETRSHILVADDGSQEVQVINIYPQAQKHVFSGFGGAFTEAAGYTFSRMPEAAKQQLINAYFGPGGLGYRFGRCSVDSCDFSLGHYSALENSTDSELSGFSIERDRQYVLPLIRAAQALCPGLEIMLTPWSPPGFMKDNGRRNGGGELLPEYGALWAKYLCRYIEEYQKEGISIFALSVQNEPNATQTWDSCRYSPEQERGFITAHLADTLALHGLDNILLTIWDHNKERLYDRAIGVLSDDKARAAVGALGYHWYSGDHFDALDLVRALFPEKQLIFTESCIEYSHYDPGDQLVHAQRYAHEIIGGLNHGMNLFLDWNLCLDHGGGPNHAQNYCAAPIMATPGGGGLELKLSYHYIGQFSRYIMPGAVCLGNTRYSALVESTACLNPDGTLVCVVMNPKKEDETCFVRINGKLAEVTVPAQGISTFYFDREELI